ncbi:GNAT family N-acetyltransferase [Micromonospora sp. DT81.3]|uniref:GNAT family N-acetyltransferase n=1 Tax=Micromonospora sp. DT81.3 TaxID=3416523 RepID=UPI003CEFDBEA
MTTIARLTASDHDEWLSLWSGYLDFYESVLTREQTELTFQRILDADSGIHGAIARDDGGHAIGITHWLTHPATWSAGPYCYLEDLYVDPAVRRSGAGAALIEHVRDWAREHGCAKVYWLTQEHNRTARSLYGRVAKDTGFVHYEIEL